MSVKIAKNKIFFITNVMYINKNPQLRVNFQTVLNTEKRVWALYCYVMHDWYSNPDTGFISCDFFARKRLQCEVR